ncbi:hypothetical protein QWY87_05990 [Lutimonas halocynthiae]|uniref:hypothetical protein n=1 Tax=Lutimonas halocynthiae TaxID=1446477 RepID=UPI0025B5FD5C|nr:hypothetical protein [Lutimonas halocynthiae]MDN3642241.1 hypothetical protein [Lutimonas halocynthiae]
MNLKEFLSELRRRKVYRVSIAYGFAAWLIAQIADLISESFEADPWVMQTIITILILGFPVTLILSWIFDIGPEGIERTLPKDVNAPTEDEPISVKLVIGSLVLIILLVIGSTWSIQEFTKGKKGSISSLAILPFDNFTGHDSLAYFVAGIQSSLIGDMQKVSALRVSSKTSSSSFQDSKTSIPEIANQLNVDAAIEGEITCMGEDSICVQIRLIRAFPEEEQIWVQNYKIERGEILNFYNNVTKQISKEIDIALTPKEDRLLATSRKVNPEAYDAFLKGTYYWEKVNEQPAKKAIEYFQLATELDPEWADPYAGLANAWALLGFFGYSPKSVTLPKTYLYLNKALELDPNSAKAHYVAAILAVWTEWDWEKGEREFLRSIELDPNDASCRMYYAHLLMILRKTNEADRQANIGIELDPMKPLILGLYGNVLWQNNDDRQGAIKVYEKSLSIDPNFGLGNRDLYEVQMEHTYKNGEYEKWIGFWNKKVESLGYWNTKGREAVLKSFDEGGHIAAIEEMIRMNEIYGKDCYLSEGVKAERYIMLKNIDKAMEVLDKGYEKRWFLMPYISPKYHYYELLKDEPRYIEILKKMDLPY